MTFSILCYCRAGFEKELASEIMEKAKGMHIEGFVKTKSDCAYVLFCPTNSEEALELWERLDVRRLIFARQLLLCFAHFSELPEKNRIEPILAEIEKNPHKDFCDVVVEVPDTNAHKELLTFCKKFRTPFEIALERKGFKKKTGSTSHLKLHAFFLESRHCYLAVSHTKRASPHFMGIPRLKLPADAPSRSTLKLEEAFLCFLTPEQRDTLLKNGCNAVDLGASPGGWTYQFVKRSVYVTAVDNANMNKPLMETGLVAHVREDGFRFVPKKPVHWLVCDMVEQPSKIIQLILKWALNHHASYFIFNLKLPMKKRYEEVTQGLRLLEENLMDHGFPYTLECKQLYHDREEVTVWLSLKK